MKRIYLFMVMMFCTVGLFAQSRVQIIHASPLPGADSVDIYADSVLIADDLNFLSATAFIDVDSGTYKIDVVAGGDEDNSNPLKSFDPVVIPDEDTLVIVANGATAEAFDLAIGQGQEATPAMGTDLLVFHGSPDAPAVDVDARDGSGATLLLVDSLAPGAFTDAYANVPAALFSLDIRANGSSDVVATFEAPLTAFNGEPAVVFAAGFLNPAEAQPGFGLYAADRLGNVVTLNSTPTGLVINELSYTGDEYVEIKNTSESDIILTGTYRLEFINGNGGTNITTTDLGNGDTIAAGGYYVVCTTSNSEPYCDRSIISGAIQNGPDAVGLVFAADTLDRLGYEGSGDGSVPSLWTETTPSAAAESGESLSRVPDGSDTDDNSVDFVAQDPTPGVSNDPAAAQVQLIHNAYDADTVSVILGASTVALDTFIFRTATPFLSIPVDSAISVVAFGSTDTTEAVQTIPGGTLMEGESYVAIASGEVDSMDFSVEVFTPARMMSAGDTLVDLLAFHGSPDAPQVLITAQDVGAIFDPISFKEFSSDYTSVPPASYLIDVNLAADTSLVATFEADLSGLGGGAATVFASGFVTPAEEMDPAFGLWATLADGTTFPLAPFVPEPDSALVQLIHNAPGADTVSVILGANTVAIDTFVFRTATPFLSIPADSSISVVGFGATDTTGAVFTIPAGTLMDDVSYVAIAAGALDSMNITVEAFAPAKMLADTTAVVEILAFHGAPDAPPVLISARNVGPLFEPLSFKDFSAAYTPVPPFNYVLDVNVAADNSPVATFLADVQTLAGQAITVFASGFAAPDPDDPAFGLWVALADGTTFPLPQADSVQLQVIHNSPNPTVDIILGPLGGQLDTLEDVAYRTATAFMTMAPGEYDIEVTLPDNGGSVFRDTVELLVGGTYVAIANGQVGNEERPFELALTDMASTGSTVEGFDITLFHGSQDAPTVDLGFTLNPALDPLFGIEDLEYGVFSFIPIPPEGLIFPTVFIQVIDSESGDVVKTFEANLPELINTTDARAAVAIASGFLGGDAASDTAFALLAVLPDGQVVEFEEVVTSNEEVAELVQEFTIFPNPVRDQAQVRFNLNEAAQVMMEIFDINGRRIQAESYGNLPAGSFTETINTFSLPMGTYLYRLRTNKGSVTARFQVVK